VGDIIVSRRNDVTIDMKPSPGHRNDRVDQVRNGNRWRVARVDSATNRVAAERTTDKARVVFEGEYLREHVTLGYAATVHSAQGVTADRCHAIVGEGATRAMLYVAMTRGRENNHAYIYRRLNGETDHEHSSPVSSPQIHRLQRGDKYSAAHVFRSILGNDDRPRTMHAEAGRTKRHLLPGTVADVLARDEQRRAARRAAWREHTATARTRQTAYERMGTVAAHGAERRVDLDADGLDL
jgi:hypothetical protein